DKEKENQICKKNFLLFHFEFSALLAFFISQAASNYNQKLLNYLTLKVCETCDLA
ncbi:unnamed protein product, partial [marine sediment metagenome]